MNKFKGTNILAVTQKVVLITFLSSEGLRNVIDSWIVDIVINYVVYIFFVLNLKSTAAVVI